MATIISISNVIRDGIAIDAIPNSVANHLTNISPLSTADEIKLAKDKETQIVDRLRRQHNAMQENGEFCHYTFNSSSPQLIQGCCYVELKDSAAVIEQKNNCLDWNKYATLIDSLTPDEFEYLSKKMISIIGGKEVLCTRHSADEGIDFLGKIPLADLLVPGLPFKGISAQTSIWVIGQSKQYKRTSISTHVVRELVGSVMLLRHGVFSTDSNPFKSVQIRPMDPVFHLIVVTGNITKNTKNLLSRAGVGFMDREMLSSQLAIKNIGKVSGKPDSKAFHKWLTS